MGDIRAKITGVMSAHWRHLVVCAAVLASATLTGTRAAEAKGCASINSGLLSMDLSASASAARNITLEKGDVVTFAFRSDGDVIGFVTLLASRNEESRLLLGGPTGTSISYAVRSSGDLTFRFSTVGSEAAMFTATCSPAAAERGAGRGKGLVETRRAARFGGHHWDRLDGMPEAEGMAPPIEAAAPAGLSPQTGRSILDPSEAPEHARQIKEPENALLTWEGARAGTSGLAGTKGEADAGPSNLGVKLRLQPAIMVGVMAQFDQAQEPRLGPTALSERNWLAGPVANVQLGSGLSVDARAAWGPMDAGTIASHAAERAMVDARVANKQSFGAWRFAPSVGLNYQQDTQHMADLGAQTIGHGRVDLRPEVAYRIDMDHGMYIEPKAMIGSFWDIGATTAPAAHPDMRLKAETGVTIGAGNGTKVEVGGSVEEGATNATNVWSGRLQVNVPLK